MRYSRSLLPDDLAAQGPLLGVVLEITPRDTAILHAKGLTPASVIPARMMIDTGAEVTTIEDGILRQLGLDPDRYSSVTGVSQEVQVCPVYRVVIAVTLHDDAGEARVATFDCEVFGVGSPMHPAPHVGLFGRDLLRHFRFTYEGDTGLFELSFRS